MDLGKRMLHQAGTVTVSVAPLLMMIGAASTVMEGATFSDALEMLDPTTAPEGM